MQETATAPPLIAGWPSPALLVESTQSVQRGPVVQRSGALALGRSAVVLRLPRPCDVDRLAVVSVADDRDPMYDSATSQPSARATRIAGMVALVTP